MVLNQIFVGESREDAPDYVLVIMASRREGTDGLGFANPGVTLLRALTPLECAFPKMRL
jgi:hypothetical protein